MKYKCLEKIKPKDIKKGSILKFINKCLMAILLGVITLIVMEYSPKFKNFMNDEVLSKNISFGFIGKLYNKYFGEILPQTNDNIVKVFNEKLIYKTKEKYYDGYKLTVDSNYLVPVIESGVVVFIGQNDEYGNIITIEGENGTTYLGEVDGNYLYITIAKNGEYLDIETYLS